MPDSKVYNELQVLKDFVQFITGLELCNDRCKRDAETILEYIEQLRFGTFSEFPVSANYSMHQPAIDIRDLGLTKLNVNFIY